MPLQGLAIGFNLALANSVARCLQARPVRLSWVKADVIAKPWSDIACAADVSAARHRARRYKSGTATLRAGGAQAQDPRRVTVTVTVTMQRRDGRTVHVRKATRPKPRHQTLGTLLKLDPNPGRTHRVFV